MEHLILKLVTSILFLLSASAAYADIGSITGFQGGGSIKRAATTTQAAKGTKIVKNDTVSTNSQGRFKITFRDNTTVNITENSRLVIDNFVYDGNNTSKGKIGLKVTLGTVRYASGGLAKGNPGGVNIRTPTATIGVRGTDFVMTVDEIGRTMIVLLPNCFDDKDPSKSIDANCPVGAIDVTTQSGTVSMNRPFQATVVENSSAPPSSPTIIRLDLSRLDNNLQIGTVQTASGFSIIQSARQEVKEKLNPAAAAADTNMSPDIGAGDIDNVEQLTNDIIRDTSGSLTQRERYDNQNPDTTRIEQSTRSTIITTSPPEPPQGDTLEMKVRPIVERTATIGWEYASLSNNNRHEARVVLPVSTQVELIVVQENVVDIYNFSGHMYPTPGLLTPQGTIFIRQVSVP